MDITPHIKSDRKVIQTYSDRGFQIGRQDYDSALILYPDHVKALPDIKTASELDEVILFPVFDNADQLDLVLIGTGKNRQPISAVVMQHFTSLGIGVEIMDTGAACRTYNVLLTEGRRLAAILFPL